MTLRQLLFQGMRKPVNHGPCDQDGRWHSNTDWLVVVCPGYLDIWSVVGHVPHSNASDGQYVYNLLLEGPQQPLSSNRLTSNLPTNR